MQHCERRAAINQDSHLSDMIENIKRIHTAGILHGDMAFEKAFRKVVLNEQGRKAIGKCLKCR